MSEFRTLNLVSIKFQNLNLASIEFICEFAKLQISNSESTTHQIAKLLQLTENRILSIVHSHFNLCHVTRIAIDIAMCDKPLQN